MLFLHRHRKLHCYSITHIKKIELRHEKTCFLYMPKQRCRSTPLFSLHRKYKLSTSFMRNFKPLAILYGCTAQFVSDLVGNLEHRFSCDAAHNVN